jgi:GxxExxY protein
MAYKVKDIESLEVNEPSVSYSKENYPLQEETFKIIGLCMEIHRELGHGFLEAVYQEAIEHELTWNKIPYQREKKYKINYKGTILNKTYIADFVIMDKIIVEVKAQESLAGANYSQLMNYLAVSDNQLGLLINFGEPSLKYKRLIRTK